MTNTKSLEIINLEDFFSKKFEHIPNCHKNTQSYLTSIFAKPKNLANQSITLIYAKAVSNYQFDLFQTVGDWLLFAKTLFPESLNGASPDYYNTLAQCSYYKCYRIMNNKWPLFEELADMFPIFVQYIQKSLLVTSFERTLLSDSLLQNKLD